jgi:hypothetical protein
MWEWPRVQPSGDFFKANGFCALANLKPPHFSSLPVLLIIILPIAQAKTDCPR